MQEKWPKQKMGACPSNRIIRLYDGHAGAGLAVVAGDKWDCVKLPDGPNVRALGVTVPHAANPGGVGVTELGEVCALADLPVQRGDLVMVGSSTGKLAPIGSTPGERYNVVGMALSDAAKDEEFILLVMPSLA